MVALIKPQFEAGKDKVGKHGIVKDPKVHRQVIQQVIGYANEAHYDVLNLDLSPIKGGQGNIEFLVHLKLSDRPGVVSNAVNIDQVLAMAKQELNTQE